MTLRSRLADWPTSRPSSTALAAWPVERDAVADALTVLMLGTELLRRHAVTTLTDEAEHILGAMAAKARVLEDLLFPSLGVLP
jgi:hypothetical protein